MSDWQVGDKAVCVDARPNPKSRSDGGLVEGRIYEVVGITGVGNNALYSQTFGLMLAGMLSDTFTGGYAAPRFRKVVKDKHEPCEEEFVTLLKRGKVAA